jgi:hypothetical protein
VLMPLDIHPRFHHYQHCYDREGSDYDSGTDYMDSCCTWV